MALDASAQANAFPETTKYYQYTATGVVAKTTTEVFAEVCPTKSDPTASLGLMVSTFSGTFKNPAHVAGATCIQSQTMWLTSLDATTAWHETAADFVVACTGREDYPVIQVQSWASEAASARSGSKSSAPASPAVPSAAQGNGAATWLGSVGWRPRHRSGGLLL